jgi:two-component system OmpR family response regulator
MVLRLRVFYVGFLPPETLESLRFTALGEDYVRSKGLHAGFDGYCQKGNAPGVLVDLISRLVQVH